MSSTVEQRQLSQELTDIERNTLSTYISLVRAFLQDYPEKNYLLEDIEEFSNEIIGQAVLMALEMFNYCIGHITQFNLQNFPVPTLLVIGGASYTLYSGGIIQARNHFSVSDGNTSGPVSEKTELYRAWGDTLLNNFIVMGTKYKESANMEGSYGKLHSDYILRYANIKVINSF